MKPKYFPDLITPKLQSVIKSTLPITITIAMSTLSGAVGGALPASAKELTNSGSITSERVERSRLPNKLIVLAHDRKIDFKVNAIVDKAGTVKEVVYRGVRTEVIEVRNLDGEVETIFISVPDLLKYAPKDCDNCDIETDSLKSLGDSLSYSEREDLKDLINRYPSLRAQLDPNKNFVIGPSNLHVHGLALGDPNSSYRPKLDPSFTPEEKAYLNMHAQVVSIEAKRKNGQRLTQQDLTTLASWNKLKNDPRVIGTSERAEFRAIKTLANLIEDTSRKP